jgi:hypothetical protein
MMFDLLIFFSFYIDFVRSNIDALTTQKYTARVECCLYYYYLGNIISTILKFDLGGSFYRWGNINMPGENHGLTTRRWENVIT